MTSGNKKHIRHLFDMLHFIRECYDNFDFSKTTPEERDYIRKNYAESIRKYRRQIRDFYRYSADPLGHSLLSGEPRTILELEKGREPDMSDGPTYFWIDPDTSMTDEDIKEIIEDNTYRCTSPYDCCGQKFTWDFHAQRTPVGVVFINRTSYDY